MTFTASIRRRRSSSSTDLNGRLGRLGLPFMSLGARRVALSIRRVKTETGATHIDLTL